MRCLRNCIIPIISLMIIFLISSGLVISPAISAGVPHKYALLVGISKYERGRKGSLDFGDLSGARDVDMMRRTLINKFGFAEEDVHVLADEKATLKGIREEFENHLINKAGPGDVVVFHFSGHGQQMKDEQGDEIDGKDECFVPFDYRVKGVRDMKDNPRLVDDELGALLSRLAEKMKDRDGKVRGDIVVILDTCHSGTGSRGIVKTRGRGWDVNLDGPEPKGESSQGREKLFEGRGLSRDDFVLISACRSNETACEDPETNIGVLTETLIKSLERSEASTSYQALFEKLQAEVISKGWGQNPQIEGNPGKLILCGTAKTDEPYVLVTPDKDDLLKMPCGMLQGITAGSVYEIYRAGGDVRDKKSLIAEAMVESVSPDSSFLKITSKYGSPDGDSFKAARAVEISHNFEASMKVYVEGSLPEIVNILKALNLAAARGNDYDLKIFRRGGRSPVVIERRDGTTVCELDDKAPDFSSLVQENLLGEARKRLFLGLSNRDIPLEMRIVKVRVRTDPGNPLKIVEAQGDLGVVIPDSSNEITLRDGDWIAFDIRNRSKIPVYVNLFDIDSEGIITPVFPSPDRVAYEDIKERNLNCVSPDGEWHRIPLGIDEKFEKYYYSRLGRPYGRESVKLIATEVPVDFSPLFHEKTMSSRGGSAVMSEVAAGDKRLNPLARLLYDARSGRRGAAPEPVQDSLWGTAEVIFQVKER